MTAAGKAFFMRRIELNSRPPGKQGDGVVHRGARQLLKREAQRFRESRGDLGNGARLVSLAAARLGRKKGGIGFQDKNRRPRRLEGRAQPLVFGIGDRAVDAEREAEPGELHGLIGVAGEAMNDSPESSSFGARGVEIPEGGEGVRESLPAVDDRGLLDRAGGVEEPFEDRQLDLSGGRALGIVKSDFAHGDDLRKLGMGFEIIEKLR